VTALLPRRETETPAQQIELDPLTGALTRQTFFANLIEQSAAANTTARSFCICLIGADQLKNINEQHGHQVGDEALAQVTRRIRLELAVTLSETYESDLARYDGNGFALLLPDSDLEMASSIADNCRRAISTNEIQRGVQLTVSIGVAQYRLWESAEDTLARAEQALHLAKQFGRDRVEVAESPKSSPQRADVIALDGSARG